MQSTCRALAFIKHGGNVEAKLRLFQLTEPIEHGGDCEGHTKSRLIPLSIKAIPQQSCTVVRYSKNV